MHLLVSGSVRAWMTCWSTNTAKKLELFEMHTCLWSGAQKWFRHRWRKLLTASLLLHCIDGYSYLRYWNEFFSAMLEVLGWSFLVLHFDGNVCNWIPKVIWLRMVWFWGFLLESGFFRWRANCMDWNLQKLLHCCSFLTTLFFFDV